MLIYIIILLLLFMNWKFRGPDWCSLIIMLFLAGLRPENIGIDLSNYIDHFNDIYDLNEDKVAREPGYSFIVSLLRSLDFSNRGYIFSMSLLSLLPFYWFLKLSETNVSLGLLIFYILENGYLFSFSGIRQSISVGFFLLMFVYFINGKKLLSVLFGFAAISFHSVALASIPLACLIFVPWNQNRIKIILIISALIGISGIFTIENGIERFLPSYLEFYSVYSYIQADSISNLTGRIVMIVPVTLYLIINTKFYKNYFYKAVLIGVILTNIGASFPFVFRYFSYFTVMQAVLIPLLLRFNKIGALSSKVYLIFLALNYLFFTLWGNMMLQIENNFVPYSINDLFK